MNIGAHGEKITQKIHKQLRRYQTSNMKGDPSMSKKIIIGCSAIVAFSLVIIAISLLSPSALANRMSGKTPFTAKPIESQFSDTLAPGQVVWYQFTDPRPNGAPRQVNMSLVFTPNQGGQERFIAFGVHDSLQLEEWYLGAVAELQNLGQTFVVVRDDDPNTGELINKSEILPDETYYLRVVNNSDYTIYYTIFIDVADIAQELIRTQELTAKSEPPPAPAAAPVAEPAPPPVQDLPPGIDPNHPVKLELAPYEVRLEEGKIPAGGEHWFSIKIAEFTNPQSRYPLKLTLFTIPVDGNQIRQIRMDLFPNTFAQLWSVGNPDAAHNFGAGMVVDRDGDPVTGEMIWNGNLVNNDTYLVRLQNGNPFDVDFYLFTDDIINTEFGEPTQPPPAMRVAPGTDPNNTLPLVMGVNEGDLAPGDERWYTVKIADFDDEVYEPLQLTLYMTPNGGNNMHKVNFELFNAGDAHIWNRGDTESMPNFGAGTAVDRDHDPETGTRVWTGWLVDNNEYLIRVRNSSGDAIHYWLFTKDIYTINLADPWEAFR